MAKHVHKWVAQMGPGPSHGCEECGAGKHMGDPFKESKGMAKRKALKNRLTGIKGFGEGDPKKD